MKIIFTKRLKQKKRSVLDFAFLEIKMFKKLNFRKFFYAENVTNKNAV